MKMVLAIILLSLAAAANACGPGERTAFSCTTLEDKVIEVCQAPDAIRFSYGEQGQKPEIRLSQPNASFLWERSEGVRTGIEDDLSFPDGSSTYAVNHIADFDNGETLQAIVSVRSVGKDSAILAECKTSTVRFSPETIKAKANEL